MGTAPITDVLTRQPSHHNLLYRLFLERQFMLRIGAALATLPESVDRLWIAHLLRRYFWRDLGLDARPDLPTELPRVLWPYGYQLPSVDMVALSARIAGLCEQVPDPLCISERKLLLLETLLHLRPAETALIKLAYAASPEGWLQSKPEAIESDQHALHAVLMCLNWSDEAERNHRFSVLLGMSLADTEALFDNLATVLALHLLDNSNWHSGNGAFAYAAATEKLFVILETQYLTHEALLADLVVQPFDWPAFPDPDITDVGYYEELPPEVAAVCVASNASLPLTAPQLVSAIWWQTCMRLPLEAVQPLDRRLELEAVSKAVSSAVVASRRANRMPADFDILKAIYTAA
jgi:hypothetical protein